MRWTIAVFMGVLSLQAASPTDLERARKLYTYTDYDGSLEILQALPQKDGSAYALIGQNFYMRGEYKKATESLEKASAAEPDNSVIELWLGRSYGRRAETSSPFTAPGNASKARQHFEKSVDLDPRNLEAMSDLLEYYLEAPGFLGGGVDKAAILAEKIAAVDPSEGHWAQARLAEKKKEFGTAEQHFQRAVETAPHKIGRLIDLALFLAKQGRYQESEQSFRKAEKIAPNSPQLLYARADLYISQGRDLDRARQLLKRYLAAPLTADDPPRASAEKLLKKVSGG